MFLLCVGICVIIWWCVRRGRKKREDGQDLVDNMHQPAPPNTPPPNSPSLPEVAEPAANPEGHGGQALQALGTGDIDSGSVHLDLHQLHHAQAGSRELLCGKADATSVCGVPTEETALHPSPSKPTQVEENCDSEFAEGGLLRLAINSGAAGFTAVREGETSEVRPVLCPYVYALLVFVRFIPSLKVKPNIAAHSAGSNQRPAQPSQTKRYGGQ